MYISWNGPLSKAVVLQEKHGKKELRFFGISIGWLAFGFIIGVDRQSNADDVHSDINSDRNEFLKKHFGANHD